MSKKKVRFKNKLVSLDSTVIVLCLSLYDWAKFRRTKGAVKLHLVLDHDGYLPCFGIITDGKDGFLVPLDDAAAMADRLALLCTDAAMNQQMGHAARATIEARYADDVAGAAFVDVWDKLLQKAGKR